MRLVWIVVVVVGGLLVGAVFTRVEQSAPKIKTRVTQVFVGVEHKHDFRILDEGMGVREVKVWLTDSEGGTIDLFSESYDGNPIMGASLAIARRVEVSFSPGDLGLPDGRATLSVEATDFSWSANVSRLDVPLSIDTQPPKIAVHTGLTYVRRGGAEMAVYSVNEKVVRQGVMIGDVFSPGFAHPADPNRFVAFYPLPPETRAGVGPVVVAEDRARNRTRVRLPISIIERSFPSDKIEISESFLERKVPEILGGEHEDLLAAYVGINRDMRAENAESIRQICSESSQERLWRGSFQQLPNSSVGARFAEQRTYEYQGRQVDRQTHMGYDLASTARAEVPAANSGVVVFEGDLGIYGRVVIIDHGMSLFSLYGHLSEVSVQKGNVVAQGETIGRTGETGLAGGDHLHYAMMVAGTFVDPLEWFDERWIQEHIEVKFRISDGNGKR